MANSLVTQERVFRYILECSNVLPGLTWPPFFAVYSLIIISIEKEISEMNLDIDRVFGLFFLLKYDLLI